MSMRDSHRSINYPLVVEVDSVNGHVTGAFNLLTFINQILQGATVPFVDETQNRA